MSKRQGGPITWVITVAYLLKILAKSFRRAAVSRNLSETHHGMPHKNSCSELPLTYFFSMLHFCKRWTLKKHFLVWNVTLQRMGLMHSLLFVARQLKDRKLRRVCIFLSEFSTFWISDNTWKLFPKLVNVVWNRVSANFQWHRGYPYSQPHLTKPEQMFCTGSTPVRRMSEVCDGKNLQQMISLEIVLDTFSVYRIINLHHCGHWNSHTHPLITPSDKDNYNLIGFMITFHL